MAIFDNYIKYHIGDIPLILSSPHGGIIKDIDIPKRSKGILGIDKQTNTLLLDLTEKLKKLFKIKTSSYIFSEIHRSRVDLNREEFNAYNKKSKLAKEIYRFYHNKVKEIVSYNLESFNRSLLVDIHGFEKSKRPEGFRDVEIILGTNNLDSLFSKPIPKKKWRDSLRGKIIQKFNELDVPIAPGHQTRKEYVLTGGYIVKNYGASRIKNSQAIQIEFSDRIRLYDKKLRAMVLNALSELLYDEFR